MIVGGLAVGLGLIYGIVSILKKGNDKRKMEKNI